ncbi:MAG TPA: tRNA (adenosine(37)-N6)-threonylcarbamoyltransferase complex transferase subunit TsaD [Verrucomicrobiae bacterium]|nr:tRNA (adenosine(37)-N6)-threonylcarbamoyltransferase complex transferase subunit TsaD [Verrucomicrobiae bacterium]
MLLAFETSCDETSAALIQGGRVLANMVSSQVGLHAEYGGVVPELAAREHLRNLLPLSAAVLKQAGAGPEQLDAVAATQGPGLPSALLVGLKAAQALAFSLRRPFLGVHHHEAHLYSPWLQGTPPVARFEELEPNVSLVVSGGHTLLVQVCGELDHRLLGSTVDDAAGECFDKTGKLMGLAYPAGPEIDRLAEKGNPKAFEFPRPMIHESNDDFSFSGLKTSVRYFLRDNPGLLREDQGLRDLCASVQKAIVDVLVSKTMRAARRLGVRWITASGGVTCNRALRQELTAACEREGFKLLLAQRALCTDNAAMIGVLAERRLLRQPAGTSLDQDIRPNWGID